MDKLQVKVAGKQVGNLIYTNDEYIYDYSLAKKIIHICISLL